MLLTLAIFIPLVGDSCCSSSRTAEGAHPLVGALVSIAAFIPMVAVGVGYAKKNTPEAAGTLLAIANERMAAVQDVTLKAEIERLRGDPTITPAKLDELPSSERAAHPDETKRAELKRKMAAPGLTAYDVWHEVWELQVAKDTTITKEMRYVEYGNWIRAFNIQYFLGVDGLSLPLVLLTGLLGIICVYYSFNIEKGVKAYMRSSCCSRPACSASSARSTSSCSTCSGKSCCCRCTSSSASGAGRGASTPRSSSSSTRSSAAC